VPGGGGGAAVAAQANAQSRADGKRAAETDNESDEEFAPLRFAAPAHERKPSQALEKRARAAETDGESEEEAWPMPVHAKKPRPQVAPTKPRITSPSPQAAAPTRAAEKRIRAAEMDDESEVEDLTLSTGKRKRSPACTSSSAAKRHVKSQMPACRSQCASSCSPVISSRASRSPVAAQNKPASPTHSPLRPPRLLQQGRPRDEEEASMLAQPVMTARGRGPATGTSVRNTNTAADKQAEKDAAKQHRDDKLQAARELKAVQAGAAKLEKAQVRDRARAAKDAEKMAHKERRAHEREEKRKKSGKCATENVFVTVDDRAAGDVRDAAMQAILAALNEKYPGQTQVRRQSVAGAVTFSRFVFSDEDCALDTHMPHAAAAAAGDAALCTRRAETAPQVIFYMQPAQLVDRVTKSTLVDWATEALSNFPTHCAPLLLVVGFDTHLRSLGSSRSKVSQQVSAATTQLLVMLRMGYRSAHSIDEAVLIMTRTTRAIAEEPYRAVPSVVDLYKDAKASSGRANSFSSGIEAFFLAIPGIGENCAKTISQEYPSLRALARKYRDVAAGSGDGERDTGSLHLLENLKFEGSSTSSRSSHRLGPKRSQRIHVLFHSRDPSTAISTLVL